MVADLPVLFSGNLNWWIAISERDVKARICGWGQPPLHLYLMKAVFFIVGPTATGKSEIAADVAVKIGAEIVSADAFQIYQGLNLLTAQPDAATLAKARHHLIGTTSIQNEMNAERFRRIALRAIKEIHSRGKLAIVVGGSGLYIKALTHGLSPIPADQQLREELRELSLKELQARLANIDPETVRQIDKKNRRRLVRALEICLLTGKPVSAQRTEWEAVAADAVRSPGPRLTTAATGVFVFRERDELYDRIDRRVEAMFEKGVVEEVRAAGVMSLTAAKAIGLREIRELLEGKRSISPCVEAIQQATRRYAKRQLTWFRHQTSFAELNLSLLTHDEAVQWISQKAFFSLSRKTDD
jgi:tRNA dimethylallyltransferase